MRGNPSLDIIQEKNFNAQNRNNNGYISSIKDMSRLFSS